MYRWMCDPEVSGNIGLRTVPTAEKTVAWVERATNDRTVSAWAILAGGDHVGNVILDRIDHARRSARLSIYVGDRRGEGVGTRAMRLMLDEAFGPLGLNRVWLTVYAGNGPALALYSAMGFRVERVVEEASLAGGGPVQVIYMGLHGSPAITI